MGRFKKNYAGAKVPLVGYNTRMLFQLDQDLKLIQVAVPLPVDDPFTYSIPTTHSAEVKPGMRVLIPFKNREIVGFVVPNQSSDSTHQRIKSVIKVLDEEPILDDHLIRLTDWIRNYYFSSWGEAINSVIPALFRSGREIKPRKSKLVEEDLVIAKQVTPTLQQTVAIDRITNLLKESRFSEILLQGVTGSGKSEIYIRAIKEAIRLERSAICLVPEIALTEQLKRFFSDHFRDQLEIVHSKLSDGERWQVWNRIRKGEKQVILGARSAIFSPLKNLGLIIIDEEQEPSYKQDQTPRYHALEVARWRAQDLNAVLISGSATPSLETQFKAADGQIIKLELTERVDSKRLPVVEIVDLNQAQSMSRNQVVISNKLEREIQKSLEVKQGILLLLNRRGFSTLAQCLKCAHPMICRFCDVPMTYHQSEAKLVCHYCNYKIEDPKKCSKCGFDLLKFKGIGTEKVESEAARLFPMARVARLDSDSARKKDGHLDILKQFRNQKIDILVGTQMIAKGFDFPHVGLVGVILADTALTLPDFRSSEKTFQLLTQVAGRSGRGSSEGRVIIQTFSPFHYSIQKAREHDVKAFYELEIEERQAFQYPPFTNLINIICRAKKEQIAIDQALLFKDVISEKFSGDDSLELIGPAPLPFARLRGHFRWHLMIKLKDKKQEKYENLRSCLRSVKRITSAQTAIDVDPQSIL